ncbi:hypothetical protein DPEC_G00075770 [Dallia pectoralis]|uniref:Uncharacterized protein n=1 Tax=Dallia pectoralis TaxID=75939 RepID=A0ACC2H3R7_DALPE|nr:hypothetical protein DPEC_G00075770 [Dallia pectoralis]
MLKMKLLMNTAEEEEGDDTAEDEEQPDLHTPRSVPSTVSGGSDDPSRHPCQLDKETVFEWFGFRLTPAKRVEFMCGLLHMCQPLELRFLGSCLEDLARKDYHVLRDSEIRANSANYLAMLSDNTVDPVVRSKLLVYVSLLGSDSRECAGVLYRILGHVDPAVFHRHDSGVSHCMDPSPHHPVHPPLADENTCGRTESSCGLPVPVDPAVGPLEQLALLFTMASLHPAFPFHQRETVLQQLNTIQLALEERQANRQRLNAQHTQVHKADYQGPVAISTEAGLDVRTQGQGEAHRASQAAPSRRTQREAVHIEKIVLKRITRSRTEREYNFEVKWSDSSSSYVTKTHIELENFLLKLPKEQSTESFEKGLLRLLNQGDSYESREVERNLKETFRLAPQAFRRTTKVCGFFQWDSSSSLIPSCSRSVQRLSASTPSGNPGPLGNSNKADCSEASSPEEGVYLEPCVPGHRRKHGSRSPSLSIPIAKSFQGESSQKGHHCSDSHSCEHNGLSDRRRKSCTVKANQDVATELCQGREKRSSHPVTLEPDRDKGKKRGKDVYLTNGSMVPHAALGVLQSTGKDASSSQDMYGDTSSESYSSPSSPHHCGPGSLNSEDEKDKDTDSHSDDSSSQARADPFYTPQEVPAGAVLPIQPLLSARPSVEPPCPETSLPDYPRITFRHPLSYMMPNGSLPVDALPDNTSAPGMNIREPLPTAVPGDQENRDAPAAVPVVLPGFGSPGLVIRTPGSPAFQPHVQRFKTAPPPATASQESVSGPPAHQPPVGAINVITHGQLYTSPLQPAYPDPANAPLPPSVPLAESMIGHAKLQGMTLPSALPSPYPVAPITSVMATMGLPGVPPPAVPTHTPGPAPSPSPALTHSTAQSDCTAYINSTSCTSNPIPQPQQQQQKPQQQAGPQQLPMGCGACGCRGGCGTGHLAPSFFFPHQVAQRQVFGMPPIFQLTSLCNSSYLSQAPPQNNGQAQLPFFPPAPYAGQTLMHTHPHSDRVLANQQGYGLQQMASPFNRFYPHMYPAGVGMTAGAGGVIGVNKKNGNVSCYNCGVGGHYAQDCKQPSIDSTQQGGFRLKYAVSHSSDTLDNAD